ncbi:hypothetical protein EVAR_77654_1 [Eumeta japonica]|uniref:Uncharacterized protein n=1 Tax=Eumeta variegata TaxID=151549 RepID=A0A4C1TA17_EUMVA|nr:hypothetical protein EVAR_77654_1 [Eumeta japonica]
MLGQIERASAVLDSARRALRYVPGHVTQIVFRVRVKHFCRLNPHPSVEYRCRTPNTYNGLQTCAHAVASGTEVFPKCKTQNYYLNKNLASMICKDGNWSYIATCLPDCGKLTPSDTMFEAEEGYFQRVKIPWHASFYEKYGLEYLNKCMGTIITTSHVLSVCRSQPTQRGQSFVRRIASCTSAPSASTPFHTTIRREISGPLVNIRIEASTGPRRCDQRKSLAVRCLLVSIVLSPLYDAPNSQQLRHRSKVSHIEDMGDYESVLSIYVFTIDNRARLPRVRARADETSATRTKALVSAANCFWDDGLRKLNPASKYAVVGGALVDAWDRLDGAVHKSKKSVRSLTNAGQRNERLSGALGTLPSANWITSGRGTQEQKANGLIAKRNGHV